MASPFSNSGTSLSAMSPCLTPTMINSSVTNGFFIFLALIVKNVNNAIYIRNTSVFFLLRDSKTFERKTWSTMVYSHTGTDSLRKYLGRECNTTCPRLFKREPCGHLCIHSIILTTKWGICFLLEFRMTFGSVITHNVQFGLQR